MRKKHLTSTLKRGDSYMQQIKHGTAMTSVILAAVYVLSQLSLFILQWVWEVKFTFFQILLPTWIMICPCVLMLTIGGLSVFYYWFITEVCGVK